MIDKIKTGIYIPNYSNFYNFLKSLFPTIKSKYLDVIFNDKNHKLLLSAFTHELIDPDNNYQYLEIVGDAVCNSFITNYFSGRFPFLKCVEGVPVLARLKINYGSKQTFFEIAKNLHFWDYISAPTELRHTKMKSLLEDVFEAFIGAIVTILDSEFCVGVGYSVAYTFMKTNFDKLNISLKYNDLFDAKTRLKELFDFNSKILTKLEYRDDVKEEGKLASTSIYCNINSTTVYLSSASASLLDDARTFASEKALVILEQKGFTKKIPYIYEELDKYITNPNYVPILKQPIIYDVSDINKLLSNHKKIKQYKYTFSPLGFSIKDKNTTLAINILRQGGNPLVTDIFNLNCYDYLFMYYSNPDEIKNILSVCKQLKFPVQLHTDVYEHKYKMIYEKSTDPFFRSLKIDVV